MQIIPSFSDVSARYDAVFCDLWGCLHNGVEPFAGAVQALERFKAHGGVVILLTNSPRPSDGVYSQLDTIGVPREVYDTVVSSGDAAQAALASGAFGQRVYHLGPERDVAFFKGIDVERVPLEDAEGIVCTGLFDDSSETPEDYRAPILYGVNKGLKMLCANPDIIVDRGDQRIYCAGALAKAYAEAGGDAQYFGKPYAPIYDLARRKLRGMIGKFDDAGVLCIGDGITTDIAGGIGEGFDTLFITGGLARQDTKTADQPDPEALDQFLLPHRLSPTLAMGMLR